MAKWIPAGKGIRYQEHPTRKHGKKPDRYWALQYKLKGRVINEAVGWWSAGASQAQCEEVLLKLRENWRSGEGPQTLREMRAFNLEKREAELAARKLAEDKSRTLGGFWETGYLPTARLSLVPTTIYNHTRTFGRWLRPLAEKPLADISPADLSNSVQRPMLEAGKSPNYVEKVLLLFSVIWNQAKAQGVVQGDNPASQIKIAKIDGRRDRFFTKAEAAALLAALKERDQETHDFALLSLYTGLRAGECKALTWADLDMESGHIFVKDTKNKRNRHAFMTAEVRVMLAARSQGQGKAARVFPNARSGAGGFHNLWQSMQ